MTAANGMGELAAYTAAAAADVRTQNGVVPGLTGGNPSPPPPAPSRATGGGGGSGPRALGADPVR